MGLKEWSHHPRRGNYSLLMGVLSFLVIGFGALAVDISLITMAELQCQATADAASHAALIVYRENADYVNPAIGQPEGTIAANWVLQRNKVAMGYATMDSGYPEYGLWDFAVAPYGAFDNTPDADDAINAVRVRISRTGANAVDMLLAPALGYNTHNVTATSITSQQDRAIMLVTDLSCSMMSFAGDQNSAIELSRKASEAFMTFLASQRQPQDNVGLAMFAQLAAAEPTGPNPPGGSPLMSPWASDCGGTVFCATGRPNGSEPPWLPISPLHIGGVPNPLVFDRIDGICDTQVGVVGDTCLLTGKPSLHLEPILDTSESYWNDIGGCTNPEPAIYQAVDELLRADLENRFRAIVFVSDGVPNCDTNMNWNDANAMSRALAAVNVAAANGIRVYTLLYHNGFFNSDFMTSTNPAIGLPRNGGFGLVAPNAAAMQPLLIEIAKSFPTSRMPVN